MPIYISFEQSASSWDLNLKYTLNYWVNCQYIKIDFTVFLQDEDAALLSEALANVVQTDEELYPRR